MGFLLTTGASGGHVIRPLDVIRIEHAGELDDPSQPENVLVDDSRWQLIGTVDPVDAADVLAPHLVEGPELLGNKGAAMLETEAVEGVDASLALVRPRKVLFRLEPPWKGRGSPRPRVAFALAGKGYDLALTDYQVAPKLMRAGLGDHDAEELGLAPGVALYLAISLAEARDGWCTKLVAAVIPLPLRS